VHTLVSHLARDYDRLVYGAAYRVADESVSAEGAMQEVFLKLYPMSSRSLDSIANWPAYLKSMAVSLSLDQLRKNKRFVFSGSEDEIEEPVQE